MVIFGLLLIMCSFLIPAYQAYLWLSELSWTPLSTNVLFSRILPDSFYLWLADDTSWLGVKNIVSFIVSDMPLFGFVLLSGLILIFFDPEKRSTVRMIKAQFTDDNWDGWKEVRKLIGEVDALRDLYKKLGYSVYLNEKSKQILDELKSLFRVEIIGISSESNLVAFQNDLTELELFYATHTEENNKLTSKERAYFKKLFKHKEDYQKVSEILKENDSWKKYLSDSNMVKKYHLTSQRQYLLLLDELEELFQRGWLPRDQEAYESIFSRIAKVRKEVNDAEEFYNSPLDLLKREIEYTCDDLLDDEVAAEKKRKIDNLLWHLVYVRHEYEAKDPYFLEVAKEQAQVYLDSDWMHNTWLKTQILSHLLEGEIAQRQIAPVSEKFILVTIVGCVVLAYLELGIYAWVWGALLVVYIFHKEWRNFIITGLQSARNEILSGAYDSEEIARRLRKQERWRIEVQSIIYSLLREKPGIEDNCPMPQEKDAIAPPADDN